MVKSGIPVPSPLSSHSLAAQGLGSKPATPTSAAAGVCWAVHVGRALRLECHGFESHPRQLNFLRKNDCLGCTVLLCLVVCLLLSSFLLISH